MTRLAELRRRLERLRSRRAGVRLAAGACAVLLALLAAVVVLFVVDFAADLDRRARLAAMLVAVAGVAFATWRWAWPWWQRRERLLDVALLVERHEGIENDLVAALEFESSGAERWGSSQLMNAVVGYVAEFGSHLNLAALPPAAPLARRVRVAIVSFAAVLAAVALFPTHARVFAERLALRSAHYPRATRIDRVLIDGRAVSASDSPVRKPYGQPLVIELHGSGRLPESGTVVLSTTADSDSASLELVALADRPGVYRGELPRLVDRVRCRFELGDDAWDWGELEPIALPVVSLAFEVTPPEYAASPDMTHGTLEGSRQISVIEGSRLSVVLDAANKPLAEATLSTGDEHYPLVATDDRRRRWRLEPEGTPLNEIREPLAYELHVRDVDGLDLAEPLTGFIRIKTDRPPRVTAALVTQYVLPTGKPSIAYGATDDYGLAELRATVQIVGEDGNTREQKLDLPMSGKRPKLVQGRWTLELSSLQVVKGDELKLTLEARDDRGSGIGQWAAAEPLVLHVTDERGVLAAMSESDQRSARQLESIIQRQLGIGD